MNKEELYDKLVDHIYTLSDTHEYLNSLNKVPPSVTEAEANLLRRLIEFVEKEEGRHD